MKSNTKILSVAVVLLLLINIALVIFMLKGKNHQEAKRPSKGDPFEMVAKELNMTDAQRKQHLQFRDEYFKIVKPLNDSVKSAKAAYFSLIKDSTVADNTLAIYNKRISDFQSAIDKITFEHFRRVRAIYVGDQQTKYDELIQKMALRQGNKGGGNWKKDSTGKGK